MTLKDMKDAFNQVMEHQKREIENDSKIAALNKFLEAFPEENPYSDEDKAMRKKANEQIAMAKRPKAGAGYTDPATGMEFILVKGGCYQMGEGSYYTVHEVCIDDFYIGKYEVTQGQWKAIMGNNPSLFKDCGDNCPVENVSWNDIRAFISRLNNNSGKSYRLPTEAEWEYAARSGGKNEEYAGTSNKSELGEYAWYSENSSGMTHPVGQKKPNELGIYDMAGNVWEWVADWYYESDYSKNSPQNNPTGPSSGKGKVLRGGSWGRDTEFLKATNRGWDEPTYQRITNGFRLSVSAH
ncbi:MAG: formylglycine-generating enzyme family protein [Deltaproteobacteria bacterium]|nr:formylglycine-generating enzyme family protein [Deltaproteobacteria bacterium]